MTYPAAGGDRPETAIGTPLFRETVVAGTQFGRAFVDRGSRPNDRVEQGCAHASRGLRRRGGAFGPAEEKRRFPFPTACIILRILKQLEWNVP